MRYRNRHWIALVMALLLVLAACGDDADDAGDDGAQATEGDADTGDTGDTDTDGGDDAEADDADAGADAGEPDQIQLTLNFLAGGPQAGFTYAKELGFYDEVNLDVDIEEGEGSVTTAQLVASGGTDIGYADGLALMQMRAEGAPIVILSPILQNNAYATISLADTGIESIEDLEGRRVGIQPAGAPGLMMPAILQEHGMTMDDIDVVDMDPAALVPTLLQGEVDAIVAGADSQAVNVRAQGFETNEQFHADHGAPTIGLSIAVNESMLDSDPDVVRRFVEASLRGWEAARDDPRAAAESLVATFPTAEVEQIEEQLLVDLQVLCADEAETIGNAPDYVWETSHQIAVDYLELSPDLPLEEYYTTDYLPDDAPAC